MGLFSIPDPVSMLEAATNAKLEREEIGALTSSCYSALITFMWASGSGKLAFWTGESQALKDSATALYLTLERLMSSDKSKPGFLTLTVPTEMLEASNLSRFQTETKEKK